MCGVIVVDAESFRSTWHGHDAYIHDHCLDILITMRFPINCSAVICSPTVCFLSREKPLVKPMAPGSIFHHIFQIYKPKNPKIPCCNFSLFILSCVSARSIYPINYNFTYLSTREGLTTPLLRRVASICSLCAGVVYVVLHGYPTCSIALVSSLREIPTVDVLHHPFLFGELPT